MPLSKKVSGIACAAFLAVSSSLPAAHAQDQERAERVAVFFAGLIELAAKTPNFPKQAKRHCDVDCVYADYEAADQKVMELIAEKLEQPVEP